MSFFSKLWAEVKSIWKNVPSESVVAASAVNNLVPWVEAIDTIADPALATVLNPILDKVKVGVSALKVTVQGAAVGSSAGTAANVVAIATSINNNMAALLSAAQVKNPAEAQKIEAIANLVASELTGIVGMYAPAPATNPTA